MNQSVKQLSSVVNDTCNNDERMHTTLRSTNNEETPLHYEDIRGALVNMLYPESTATLNILGHELIPLENYKNTLQLNVTYSIVSTSSTARVKTSMIVKTFPVALDKQQLFSQELMFHRYINPQLRQIMLQMMTSPIPQCFLARGSSSEIPIHRNSSFPVHRGPPEPGCDIVDAAKVVVLQDVTKDGLRKVCETIEVNFQYCASALKSLATLHAVSVVLDRTDPQIKHGSYLRAAFPNLVSRKGLITNMDAIFDTGMKAIGFLGPHMDTQVLLPGRDVPRVIRFMLKNLYSLLEEILKPHPSQLNALCHCNCFDMSNFLFALDVKNQPGFCQLTGMSQVRYCRPAVDVALILYCAANRQVRKTKIHSLLEIYRDHFNTALERCQKKFHISLPYSSGLLGLSQLQESLDGTRLLGVSMRALIVALDVGSCDLVNDLKPFEETALREYTINPEYRARVTEAVSDLLTSVEPYVGDCWLKSQHFDCPHQIVKRTAAI